ncbi:hypothetical protein ACLI09_08820 [Flavobacterium sp. RHBU_24]|uniref:hypothetical protein n=1 Tax=Flavobacterium sp. RHBU_24 TaxID=3391185 RepID=UPI003984D6B4
MAYDNLNEVDFDGVEINKEVLAAIEKSVSILADHKFLPVRLTVVCLDLYIDGSIVGEYQIYIDEGNLVIDDVLEIY